MMITAHVRVYEIENIAQSVSVMVEAKADVISSAVIPLYTALRNETTTYASFREMRIYQSESKYDHHGAPGRGQCLFPPSPVSLHTPLAPP